MKMPSLVLTCPVPIVPDVGHIMFVVIRARFAAYGCDQDTSAPADVYTRAAHVSDCKRFRLLRW
jgi:hypothetical protein